MTRALKGVAIDIEFLGHTDTIQQTPLINFLSPQLEDLGQ